LRRLLLVPIVHDPADMGTAGLGLLRQTLRLTGEQRWAAHERVLSQFWQRVGEHLRTFEAGRLGVYQDGLPAGGDIGRRIVAEAAARGSRNHELVLELIDRGAELRRTEDVALLLREQARTRLEAAGGSRMAGGAGLLPPDRLLAERDGAMARNIAASLAEGEIGVLFVGAQHEVERLLPEDVAVEPVKDPRRVAAYLSALFLPGEDAAFTRLGEYLAAPVEV
jgi:hypothetical protein